MDLEGFDDREAPTLSGGEARASPSPAPSPRSPGSFSSTSPSAPLDAPRRAGLLDRLARVEEELGLTTLHVTHDHGGRAGGDAPVALGEDGSLSATRV